MGAQKPRNKSNSWNPKWVPFEILKQLSKQAEMIFFFLMSAPLVVILIQFYFKKNCLSRFFVIYFIWFFVYFFFLALIWISPGPGTSSTPTPTTTTIQCRFNYKINEVFRELMGCTGIGGYNVTGMNFSQGAHDKDKCNIL